MIKDGRCRIKLGKVRGTVYKTLTILRGSGKPISVQSTNTISPHNYAS